MKILLIISLVIGFAMSISIRQQPNMSMANATNLTAHNTSDRNISALKELIPKFFFVNKLGRPGTEFIAFKNIDGYFLGCDNKTHNLNIENKNITLNELWVPEYIEKEKKVALRNYFGGYLNFKDSKFNCQSKALEMSNMFDVEKIIDPKKYQLTNVTDSNELLALRIKPNIYLGVENRMVLPINNLNKSAIFFAPFKKEDF